MQRELSDLLNLVPIFKQSARCLMPQVVEAQVLNSEEVARTRERRSNTLRLIRENVLARARLPLHDLPSFRRVLEASMVPLLLGRVFGVPHQSGPPAGVVVSPFEATNLRLPSRGVDRKCQNIAHRDFRASVATGEEAIEPRQFLGGRTSVAPIRLGGLKGSAKHLG
jgi:hypothetical protein